MTDIVEMTPQEIREFCWEWQQHLDMLEGVVHESYLLIARSAIQPENFNYNGGGNLRPNKELARYDLYDMLVPAPGVRDALLVCRLTEAEERRATELSDPARIEIDDGNFEERFLNLKDGLIELGYPAEV